MRIFHIISRLDIGGAEQVAFGIAKSSNPDFEYHLIEVFHSNSKYAVDFENSARQHGITVHTATAGSSKSGILQFPSRLHKLIKIYRPDIIHCHTEIPDLSLFLHSLIYPRQLRNIKIVRTVHNNVLWSNWKLIGQIVEKFMQKNATIITISKSTQESYHTTYSLKCPIIPNGVEIPEKKRFEHLVNGKTNILFAARFEPQKGIETLIRVIQRFGTDTRFHFHIAGNGSLEHLINDSIGHNQNCSFYQSIYNLPAYINSFDFLFMPSLFEGLPLTAIESSLSGTPVIINAAPGLEETLPSDWPLKAERNNVDSFCHIFSSMDNYQYSELQKKASEFAMSHFSIQNMQQSYEKIYYAFFS